MSEALAGVQEAEAQLADVCEQDSRAAAGSLLAEHVRSAAAEHSRPGVFRSANALLFRITRGRLRLELEEQSDPSFVALDQVRNKVLQLEELSAGERVQLLLAVRLGFAEQDEQRARLPLFLDETLGNADDERAAAVIDALIRLAADGRQIFYFSAQADEIGKWQARLLDGEADYALFDLQRIRGLSEQESAPLRIEAPELPEIPSPDGVSHAEYGRILNVPGLDPLRRAPGETHLWHLVDDPEQPHSLLCNGFSRLGQVLGLIRNGGDALLPDGDWTERFLTRARALEEIWSHWLAGRGLPLDREVLQDSGAVTERFMEQVCELAREVDWDPRALLQGLQNGRVPRWQSAKTEKLRDYLESAGYLDSREPLDHDALRLSVLSRLADSIPEGLGITFGNFRIKGVGFGASGVLIVAMLAGYLYQFDPVPILQDLGIVLFLLCVGLEAGPSFLRAFKQHGKRFITNVIVLLVVSGINTVAIIYLTGIPVGIGLGLFGGAFTSSLALVSALQFSPETEVTDTSWPIPSACWGSSSSSASPCASCASGSRRKPAPIRAWWPSFTASQTSGTTKS